MSKSNRGHSHEFFTKECACAAAPPDELPVELAATPSAVTAAMQSAEAPATPAAAPPAELAIVAARSTLKQRIQEGIDAGVEDLVRQGIKREAATADFPLLIKDKVLEEKSDGAQSDD